MVDKVVQLYYGTEKIVDVTISVPTELDTYVKLALQIKGLAMMNSSELIATLYNMYKEAHP